MCQGQVKVKSNPAKGVSSYTRPPTSCMAEEAGAIYRQHDSTQDERSITQVNTSTMHHSVGRETNSFHEAFVCSLGGGRASSTSSTRGLAPFSKQRVSCGAGSYNSKRGNRPFIYKKSNLALFCGGRMAVESSSRDSLASSKR